MPEVLDVPLTANLTMVERIAAIVKASDKPLDQSAIQKQLKVGGIAFGKKGYSVDDLRAKLDEAVAEGLIFAHPPATANSVPKYAKTPPPPPPPPLDESILRVLEKAPGPLDMKALRTGLADLGAIVNSGKSKTPDTDIERSIAGLASTGRCFRQPSGKSGAMRTWNRDEVSAVRDAALRAAAYSLTLKDLTKVLQDESKGVDQSFVERIVRDLIGDDRLYEHQPAKAGGAPKYSTTPPPPPPRWYESGGYKKPFADLVKAARKMLAAGDCTPAEVLAALTAALHPEPNDAPEAHSQSAPQIAELEALIVDTVRKQQPVAAMFLNELRRAMPAHYRGPEFDAAVLRLARGRTVTLQQDAIPIDRSPKEEAEFVRDEQGTLFTGIGA